jgi:hypothetical protein
MSKNLDREFFEETESKIYSMKSSNIPNKMEYDYNMIIKSTKYEEVHDAYEVLKPIIKHALELPIQKEIIVNNEEE